MVEGDEDKGIQVETTSGLKIPPTIGLDWIGVLARKKLLEGPRRN